MLLLKTVDDLLEQKGVRKQPSAFLEPGGGDGGWALQSRDDVLISEHSQPLLPGLVLTQSTHGPATATNDEQAKSRALAILWPWAEPSLFKEDENN